MSCETQCCVLSRGEFFISDWQSDCVGGLPGIACTAVQKPFKKVGNVSTAAVEITAQILGKENQYNKLDDTCARTLIEGVQITVTFACASRANLYRALFSEEPEIDSGRHIKEFCIDSLSECDFFPFDKMQASADNLDVFLVDAMGLVITELVVDTDYKFSRSGVEILRDDIDIDDATTLRMAYDYNTENFFEMKFGSKMQGYKSLFFKGTNYADDETVVFDAIFPKVIFSPINQFDLIQTGEFLTLTLVGSVEKTSDGWFKITKQEG